MDKIIPLAIPVFFALIGVEAVVARWLGRPDYLRFNDAIAAISCGIGSQVVKVFLGVATVLSYTWLYQASEPVWSAINPFAPFSVGAWVVATLLVDHQYYWWHRHSHRVNAMWAAHVVHHQSQEYNLAVALRQAMFTTITTIPYYLPLAIIGVHPVVFLLSVAVNTLYQFWIHTRTIRRMGPLEWVLNTPSHHRVHHGINPQYIDRNHAGILIVWDRLYGTFEPEIEEPVYGTVEVLDSFDPIWANFAYWQRLWRMATQASSWRDKLWVWFAPPEWSPDGIKEVPAVSAETFQKWDVQPASGLVPYVTAQFVVFGTAGTVWILWMEKEASLGWLALLGAHILLATWSWSQMFHRRERGVLAEALSLLILPGTVSLLTATSAVWAEMTFASLAWALVSSVWLARHRRSWTEPVAADGSRSVSAQRAAV
jgi:alkylglycerol monooxygenase